MSPKFQSTTSPKFWVGNADLGKRIISKKGDPHKINYESPFTAISFISFFEKKFKSIGACSGYKIAGLFLPGHFIPTPFFNEFSSLP